MRSKYQTGDNRPIKQTEKHDAYDEHLDVAGQGRRRFCQHGHDRRPADRPGRHPDPGLLIRPEPSLSFDQESFDDLDEDRDV